MWFDVLPMKEWQGEVEALGEWQNQLAEEETIGDQCFGSCDLVIWCI